MARSTAAAPKRAPAPTRTAFNRLSQVLQRGASPERMVREVESVVDDLRTAGDEEELRTWLEELHEGFKESTEAAIEAMLDGVNGGEIPLAAAADIGRAKRIEDARGRYIHFAKSTFPEELRLDGLKIVVDCAHGAAYSVAPAALWELGADVEAIGVAPNGFNVNDGVGSTHPQLLQAEVVRLLQTDDPVRGIRVLVETGLIEEFLPEVPALRLEVDEHHHHKDVYEHSLTVLRQATELEDEGPDLKLRWAALMHDIGKPDTRELKPGGGVSFHHHEVVGAKLTRKRMRNLKYPKHVIEDVGQLGLGGLLVVSHGRPRSLRRPG